MERKKWIQVKAKLILKFGTVKRAASFLDCHPNALRYSVAGKCPRVAFRLNASLNEP